MDGKRSSEYLESIWYGHAASGAYSGVGLCPGHLSLLAGMLSFFYPSTSTTTDSMYPTMARVKFIRATLRWCVVNRSNNAVVIEPHLLTNRSSTGQQDSPVDYMDYDTTAGVYMMTTKDTSAVLGAGKTLPDGTNAAFLSQFRKGNTAFDFPSLCGKFLIKRKKAITILPGRCATFTLKMRPLTCQEFGLTFHWDYVKRKEPWLLFKIYGVPAGPTGAINFTSPFAVGMLGEWSCNFQLADREMGMTYAANMNALTGATTIANQVFNYALGNQISATYTAT